MANTNRRIVDLRDIESKLNRHMRELNDLYSGVRSKLESGLHFAELENIALFVKTDKHGNRSLNKETGKPETPRFEQEIIRLRNTVELLHDKKPVSPGATEAIRSALDAGQLELLDKWTPALKQTSEDVWALVIKTLINGAFFNKTLLAEEETAKLEQWFEATGHTWPTELVVKVKPAVLTITSKVEKSALKLLKTLQGTEHPFGRYLIPADMRPDIVANEYNRKHDLQPIQTGASRRWCFVRSVMETSEHWNNDRPIDLIDDLIPRNEDEDGKPEFFRKLTGKKIRDRLNGMGFNAVFELVSFESDFEDPYYTPPLFNPLAFDRELGKGATKELMGVLSHYRIAVSSNNDGMRFVFNPLTVNPRKQKWFKAAKVLANSWQLNPHRTVASDEEAKLLEREKQLNEQLAFLQLEAEVEDEKAKSEATDKQDKLRSLRNEILQSLDSPPYGIASKGQAEVYVDGQRRVEDVR